MARLRRIRSGPVSIPLGSLATLAPQRVQKTALSRMGFWQVEHLGTIGRAHSTRHATATSRERSNGSFLTSETSVRVPAKLLSPETDLPTLKGTFQKRKRGHV